MSDPSKIVKLHRNSEIDDPRLLVTLNVAELKQIVLDGIKAALNGDAIRPLEKDNLLKPEDAAKMLGVEVPWLYRHSKKLPFTRKLSRKVLRFSERGLMKWREAKRV